jgi:L-aspartate semialdehyde sulfurtransferase ferredoxin
MAPISTRVFLTFPQRLIQEPILYDLAQRFTVKTNIRGASVTDVIALVALQIDGEPKDVEAAIVHLKGLGVQVERLTE